MRSSQKGHGRGEGGWGGEGRGERSPRVGSLFSEPGAAAEGFFKLQANAMMRFVCCQDPVGCSVEDTWREAAWGWE